MHRSIPLFCLLLLQALAWRFAPTWVLGPILLVVFGYAVYLSDKHPQNWRLFAGLSIAVAAITTCLGSFESLWPCELACTNGEIYQSVFDIQILHVAMMLYAVCAVAFFCIRGSCCMGLVQALGFMLVGASFFYLGLSVYLKMICPLCLAIHSSILCAGVFLWAQRPQTTKAIWHIADGALLMIGVYALASALAPSLPTEDPDEQNQAINAFMGNGKTTTVKYDQALLEQIEQGRSIGNNDAPYELACYLRLGCTHCERVLPQISKDAKGITEKGTVKIRYRYLINRQSKKDIHRHYLVFAAASRGALEIAQSALIGTESERIGFSESLIAFGLDPQPLESLVERQTTTFDQINLRDFKLLEKATQNASQTPFFFLIKDGELIKQWDGSTPWAEIVLYTQGLTE